MENPLSDAFRTWYRHESEATAKVLASLEGIPEGRRDGPEARRAVDVAAHMVSARWTWLHRLGAAPPPPFPVFPTDARLDDVRACARDADRLWTAYFEDLDDAKLGVEVAYRSTDDGAWRNDVAEILAQLNGHACYHRGQVAMLVRQAGGTPAITDFIYATRRPAG